MSPLPSNEEDRQQQPPVNAQTLNLQRTIAAGQTLVTRRSGVLAQLYFCEGCCCGRTDRGFPALPKDWIKEQWKTHRLNECIQLTISGCLGPCDLANVAHVVSASGESHWFGGLGELWHYESLVAWAQRCHTTKQWQSLPRTLEPFRFARFLATQNSACDR